MVGNKEVKDRPVFIPPRKRQSTKKFNSLSLNYVDHISNIQNQKCDKTFIKRDLSNSEELTPEEEQQDPPELNISNKILENDLQEENELQNFENISQKGNITQTPSSYSESSLDRRSYKSHECLTTRSSKKRVNIQTNDHIKDKQSPSLSNYDDLESGDTSILNGELDRSSLDVYPKKSDNYLTMTGTIKRGKKKGVQLDVQFNISREELEKINAVALAVEQSNQKNLCCICNLTTGLHILLLSIITLPFVTLVTSIYSFYIGTLTWYSIFNYFNEEKSYFYKFLMSPILIVTYPFAIVLCTLGLGIYAGFIQISLCFTNWINEVNDIEKGFYGWLCGFLHLSDCSPYEVVILTDFRPPIENQVHSSTEELSL